MRSARGLLLALLMVGCAANIGLTLRRGLVLSALDGEVSRIEVRHEKHPGVDDVYIVTVGSRTRVVDAEIARALSEGDIVNKEPFDMHLVVSGDRKVATPMSRDATGTLVAMPALLGLGALVLFVLNPPSANHN